MKRLFVIALATIATLTVTSCKCCSDKCKKADTADAECCAVENQTPIDIVEKYLAEVVAPNYAPGEFHIPVTVYSKIDESNPEEVTVLGDFWILNYNQTGDTLKCVSGGNHSGLLHLKKGEDGTLGVAEFDQVADGSDNLSSAQRIFGDLFDEYAAIHANQDFRDSLINRAITNFVKKSGLDVNFYQDYGWPAVKIDR